MLKTRTVPRHPGNRVRPKASVIPRAGKDGSRTRSLEKVPPVMAGWMIRVVSGVPLDEVLLPMAVRSGMSKNKNDSKDYVNVCPGEHISSARRRKRGKR
jgi:hypothetical protein